MTDKLLPCPFCGGKASDAGEVKYDAKYAIKQGWEQATFFYCNCVACGADNKGIVGHHTKSDAVAAWNRRIPAPQAHLRVTDPSTIAQFVGALADHGVKLPLLPTDEDIGTLVDADRKPVLVVDVDRERSDEDVAWIVGMIQVAVNTCGGFKAQRREGSADAD
jgi:Lar family restriction alleviation protein